MLLVLVIVVAGTAYLAISLVRESETAIRVSTDIRRQVLDMDRGMERARRLNGDFFLQYPAVGLAVAHQQYAQPSIRQVAQVITDGKQLRALMSRSQVADFFSHHQTDLTLYLSLAKRFADTSIESVERVTELATPDRGLEARLADLFNEISKDIQAVDPLVSQFRDIRAMAAEYRVDRKRFHMQAAFNTVFTLRQMVSERPWLGPARINRIQSKLDQLVTTAEAIMVIDVLIRGHVRDFALQAEALAPASVALVTAAGDAVAEARARIAKAHQIALTVMASTTLAAMILGGGIAFMLNRRISRRVVRLTVAAGRLRAGHLDVLANQDGGDELGELGRTFNVMANRIRDQVNHLEQEVANRTAELSKSERRFRQLFEHSTSGVAVYEACDDGADFVFRDINRAVETIENVNRKDVIGKRVTDVFPGIVEMGLLDVLRHVWHSGVPAQHPVTMYQDDRLMGWRDNSVIKLPGGEIVAIYDDLTVQKQAELDKEAMQAQLQQAQKMEAIGLLAGGIAHDFNNILGIILGNAELAMDDTPDWHPANESLGEIRTASLRAKDVIRQLLSFSRKSASEMQTVSLASVVRESVALMRASIPKQIEIRQDIDDDLPLVSADLTQIHQVMINLCTNAAHAMEADGGILHIALSRIELDRRRDQANIRVPAGDYLRLLVSDTGCGIQPKLLDRIFDPYFTTKSMDKGTGMGLAVVHGIVENHGGYLLVDSSPDRGSVFEFLLPVVPGTLSPAADLADKAVPGGSERVLLVDDEQALLRYVSTALKRLGYAVTAVNEPNAALDTFRADPESVDLVITDMAMPQMSGDKLATAMLGIRSDLPIILCTGFSDRVDQATVERLGVRRLIKKPITKAELGAAVRDVLGNG